MGQYEPLSAVLDQQHDAQWIDSNGARWTSAEVRSHLTDRQAMTLLEWQVLEIPNCGMFPMLRDREGKPWLVRDDRRQDVDQCVKLIGRRLDREQLGDEGRARTTPGGTVRHATWRPGHHIPRLPAGNLT
jgi:hypothetical protein